MPGFNDITGRTFGRLTVIRHEHRRGAHQIWRCRCDCGIEHCVRADHLNQGRVRSCGCLHRELASRRAGTHRLSRTPMHKLWLSMLNRCSNPNERGYKNYGGRGIKVCARWQTFTNFLADMGERPVGMSLDRIDNNGNYEPGNVRWANQSEQSNNTRANRRITAFGRTLNLIQWARESGVQRSTIEQRLKRGWPAEIAVSKPPR